MMRYAIYFLLLLACPAFSAEPVYTWQYRADDPDRVYLYRDGKQIGGWCYREKHYRPFDGVNWGQPSAASPVQPPERRPPSERDMWENAPLYALGLLFNADLFARVEMHSGLKDKAGTDDLTKELLTKGSAGVFLAERAKFAEKLGEEKFVNPALAMIYLEIEDDDPKWQPLIRNRWFQSMPSFANSGLPQTLEEANPVVLVLLSHKVRKAPDKDKIPVSAHCSFVFMAMKNGKGFMKAMSFDVYLEKVEQRKDSVTYPWKVRNVEYK
jgi:hypothetical protein